MKSIKNRVLTFFIIICMVLGGMPEEKCSKAATVRLNKTKVQLSVGGTVKLKVKGTKKKVTWSVANKKVLSVTKKWKVTH